MKFDKNDTAVVMIDPQNEVLSETGLGWPLLRESLHENNTVENRERIFKAAKEFGFEFIPCDTVKSLSCDKSCKMGIPFTQVAPTDCALSFIFFEVGWTIRS